MKTIGSEVSRLARLVADQNRAPWPSVSCDDPEWIAEYAEAEREADEAWRVLLRLVGPEEAMVRICYYMGYR
jgi:D-serine deaminase-like pyridoxal phosphate-dependent protein